MRVRVRAFVGSMYVRVEKMPSTLLYVRQMPVCAYAGFVCDCVGVVVLNRGLCRWHPLWVGVYLL